MHFRSLAVGSHRWVANPAAGVRLAGRDVVDVSIEQWPGIAVCDLRLVRPVSGRDRAGLCGNSTGIFHTQRGRRPRRHRADGDIARHGAWRLALGPVTTGIRSEEHTSELQSLMRSSYAV